MKACWEPGALSKWGVDSNQRSLASGWGVGGSAVRGKGWEAAGNPSYRLASSGEVLISRISCL